MRGSDKIADEFTRYLQSFMHSTCVPLPPTGDARLHTRLSYEKATSGQGGRPGAGYHGG